MLASKHEWKLTNYYGKYLYIFSKIKFIDGLQKHRIGWVVNLMQ